MTNLLATVVPKSEQLNFDDFSAGVTRTIRITKVSMVSGEQPIAVNYDGDNGKPFMPCKSMRRVLINCWGADGNQYVGRSMTLYGDPKVKFGGAEVGGIRISHLSHITQPITMALTATKASRKPFTVQPLVTDEAPLPTLGDLLADIESAPNMEGLEFKYKAAVRAFKEDDQRKKIVAAKEKRKKELTAPAETATE